MESNSDGQARLAEFLQGLEQLGWTRDRNVRIDVRWEAMTILANPRWS